MLLTSNKELGGKNWRRDSAETTKKNGTGLDKR